ncbi:hypothetical protein Tsubulata_040970 [Turnera subulata]|uniref:Tyrosinase copper-binding domain-containing protein n=1 Tax=Turnera subulata TaxID=218843 RepID=A0A9Q0FVE9_9ROSI|nr:hypothetical protein Tsubulata_040970 [Turnera subulata]
MEARKCSFALTIVLVMAALPLILRVMDSPKGQHVLIWELKSITQTILPTPWLTGKRQDHKTFGVSPNLTSCHASLGRKDLPVYCCPPRNELNDTVIVDFRFPNPSSPSRVRRATHLLDDEYIAKYNKALSIMKSLPYSDPRSYTRQANLHCLFCTGSYDQKYSNFQLKIHRSWMFFPWHRMLLHFHERILGSLIGDDTFALPFWAWDIPEGMTIPDMFMNKNSSFFHAERDTSHFPPSVVDLDYTCKESGLNPEDQVSTNLATMYHQMVSGAKKTELFMGCPYRPGEGGFCNGPGTIELAPHNTVHKWVGNNLHPVSREDMGVFYSAARDPIFYPHHANIDRLWNIWRELHGDKIINDPDWLDSYFYFYDEKLQLIRIKVGDVLDSTKLGYVYEEVDISPWLNARPKPSVPPEVARHILKTRHDENPQKLARSNHIQSSDFRPGGRILDSSLTVRVIRPKFHRSKKEREEEEVLVVHGIDVKADVFAKFDVYVNVVNETIISPRFREFAGTFVHIPPGVRLMREENEKESRKTDLKLGISEILEDLEAEGEQHIWITLLPRTQSCMNTTVDGIRIEYMK